MMRLIVNWSTGVDYEAAWTENRGIEYESPEAFRTDFRKFCEENAPPLNKKDPYYIPGYFAFAGMVFQWKDVVGYDYYKKVLQVSIPEVMTVDEWFEQQAELTKEFPTNTKL